MNINQILEDIIATLMVIDMIIDTYKYLKRRDNDEF